MPRGKSTFIGPRLQNGDIKQGNPKAQKAMKIEKNRLRKLDNFPNQLKKLRRRGRPLWLESSENLDSKSSAKRTRKWFRENENLLGTFQRYLNHEELERKKELARKGGHTRRLRILENGSSYYSLTQVLVTYGKNCHICNSLIDLKASRRVGVGDWFLGLHIDHLTPIAKGGADTLENVRPSHAICNLKKGSS